MTDSTQTYGRQFADIYDDIFPRSAISDAETSWLRDVIGRASVVVELGVGTGRVAVPLAAALAQTRKEVTYIGVDASTEMLDRLAEADASRSIVPRQGDMRWPDYPADVDAVVCVCGTISMLTSSADQSTVFEGAARALRPGGVLIIETHDPDVVRRLHAGRQDVTYAVPGPRERTALVSFSRLSGTAWHVDHVWIDGTTAVFPSEDSRLTTLDELDDHAASAGLVVECHARGLNGAPLEAQWPTVTAVYRKPVA